MDIGNLLVDGYKSLVAKGGDASSIRWVLLFTTILSNLLLWPTWLYICIKTNTVVDIPFGVYTTYGVANGITMVGKVWQRHVERAAEPCIEEPPKDTNTTTVT